MGRQVTRQPNGKWAMISTVTDQICAVDLTKEEIIESICLSKIRQMEKEIEELRKCSETFFTDPGREVPWEKAIQWQWLRSAKHGHNLESWQYIKEHIDPTIDEIAAKMQFNEDGEWIN